MSSQSKRLDITKEINDISKENKKDKFKLIKKIWNFIDEKILNNIYYSIKGFFNRIWNLIRWFPVIWNDQDWDTNYIYKVLRFKLENTSKYLIKRNFFVGVERECQLINTCVKLIKRLEDSYYEEEFYEFYENEIKFEPIKDSDLFEINFVTTRDDLDGYFNKYKRLYNKIVKEFPDSERHTIAIRMSRYREQKARKLLFDILYKKIEYWWD